MFGPIPVVRVEWENPEGFCEINEADFDPKIHKLFVEHEEKVPELTAAQIRAALDAKGIAHKSTLSKAELQALLDAT